MSLIICIARTCRCLRWDCGFCPNLTPVTTVISLRTSCDSVVTAAPATPAWTWAGLDGSVLIHSLTSYKETLTILYKSIIRPLLEYGSPVWSPWHKKDESLIEKIQAKLTKISNDPINLEELKVRRERCDLIEVYKFLNNKYKTNHEKFFQLSHLPLRGHPLKLKKNQCSTDTRKHFFSHRVIDSWNALPEEVVTAPSLDCFKNRLKSLHLA